MEENPSRLEIETPKKGEKIFQSISQDIRRRIAANPMGLCPVDMTLCYLRLCHAQSCGKCVPCRIGLGQLEKMIQSILDGDGEEGSLERIISTAKAIRDTADCAIGYEAANMVLKAVNGFRDDFEEHISRGRCSYGTKLSIPCMQACPAHVDVPGYIALIKKGQYAEAIKLIRKDNPFPSVCGYVCEHPCEKKCRRALVDAPINICGLKRYAADHAGEIETPKCAPKTGKKVAVIGGGPGGLTAAYYLTLMGHEVTVYEQREKLGGMLRYGIPDYRLPQEILDHDIDYILKTGVKAVTKTNVGDDIPLEKIKKEYDAVYLSIGAHDHRKLRIAGEEGKNVYSAVEMLREVGNGKKPDYSGKRVVIVGGGNVAMDATRTSLRLGAKSVICVYRRRIEDMSAQAEEIADAQAEGAKILTLHAPDHIELDETGKAIAFIAQPQIISEVDENGRTNVRKADKPTLRIPADIIIVAIGQSIHSEPFEKEGMKTHRGAIEAERSSFVPGSGNVFAGGDAVSGPATVILAVAAGKVGADNIDDFLGYDHKISVDVKIPNPDSFNVTPCGRVILTSRDIKHIQGDFDLVSEGMSKEEAKQESSRCLRCDRFGYGLFKGGRVEKW